MELNEAEKRQLFQVDGDCQAKVLDELYMTARFTRNPEQRDMVRGLMAVAVNLKQLPFFFFVKFHVNFLLLKMGAKKGRPSD